MGPRLSNFAAAVLMLGVALLGPAPAAEAAGEPDTGAFNAFNLEGSNGYRIRVWAVSGKGYRHGQVLVFVSREKQAVTYFSPATVTDTTVKADLGPLGEIDVAFQPSGEKGVAHPVCDRTQRATYEKGAYVGTVDLRGEEGYTRVSAERVPYSLHPFIDFICGTGSSGETIGHGIPGARLRARMEAGERNVELQVNQNHPGGRVKVAASIDERRGRVAISREVTFTYPATSFDFAPDLRSARLKPPAPFSGAALYARGAAPQNRWTGNLATDFPGHSNVSLTGASFRAALVHARLVEETSRRERPNPLAWVDAGAD